MSLSHDPDRAEDLVQDTLLRACANCESFHLDTNLGAWLFTILRNCFHSEYRKRKREVEDGEGAYAQTLITIPDQLPRLELQDLSTALSSLSPEQRDAILLVGAEGLSYESAAMVLGVAVGTVKSRVNRARTHLAILLDPGADDPAGTRLSRSRPKGCRGQSR